MKIALSCETTVDLPQSMLKEFDIKTIPFTVMLDDKEILDNEEVPQQIFDFVAKTKQLPKTSAINEEQYRQHFSKLLKTYDAIIHISLSSKISSSCSHAIDAAKSINEDKIKIIDSLSLSTGIALLAITARKLINEGKELNEICDIVNNKRPYVRASFVVDTLDYLYKGGRCSALACFGANLFKIKPEIVVDNGVMHPTKKFIGSISLVIKNYCTEVLKKNPNPDLETVFITYSSAKQEDVDTLKKRLKERGFKNIYATTAGGTITSHCGPGTLGVLFINNPE